MTIEQAKSELMQMYGALAPNKQIAIDTLIKASVKSQESQIRPKGHWINHADEGYVECPKCGSATNCDDNIGDLHFCFSCGAEMSEVEDGNVN